jgi:hypothetical protein
VWKSVNGGISWEPVFDDQPVSSIGDVTVSQSEPHVVWVGTGEGNNSRLFEIAPVLVCLDHAAKKQLKLPGDHQAVRDRRGGVSDRRGP